MANHICHSQNAYGRAGRKHAQGAGGKWFLSAGASGGYHHLGL